MESFGKVEAFAETLVSGLDRSWQKPPGVTAKLIDSKASKGKNTISKLKKKFLSDTSACSLVCGLHEQDSITSSTRCKTLENLAGICMLQLEWQQTVGTTVYTLSQDR